MFTGENILEETTSMLEACLKHAEILFMLNKKTLAASSAQKYKPEHVLGYRLEHVLGYSDLHSKLFPKLLQVHKNTSQSMFWATVWNMFWILLGAGRPEHVLGDPEHALGDLLQAGYPKQLQAGGISKTKDRFYVNQIFFLKKQMSTCSSMLQACYKHASSMQEHVLGCQFTTI